MPYSVRAILGSSDEVMKKGCICWLIEMPDFTNRPIHTIRIVGKSRGGRNITRTLALTDISRFLASSFEKFPDSRITFSTKASAKAIADQLESARSAFITPRLSINHDADWIRRSPRSPP